MKKLTTLLLGVIVASTMLSGCGLLNGTLFPSKSSNSANLAAPNDQGSSDNDGGYTYYY